MKNKVNEEKIKAYKAFDADLTCRGFQYEIGKTYEHPGEIDICKSGFHSCIKPADVLSYYPCVQWTRFCEVEAWGDVQKGDDSKIASRFITVVKEISFMDFIKLCVNDSEGVNGSYGVTRSEGVNGSLGVNECKGINGSVFCSKLTNTFIFNKSVASERANEVYNKLKDKLHGWYPHYNNLHTLYLKHGSDWKKTPIPQAGEVQKNEAWKDMPIEAIDYLKSLPEFDADIFFDVTGIKC